MLRDSRRILPGGGRARPLPDGRLRRFRPAAALLALLCAAPALAHGLAVSGAWIRLLPGDLPAAGYFVLHNDGDRAAKLVGASTPAFASAQLHKTVEAHGLDKMVPVKSIPVAAHGALRFHPGSYHIMLMHRQRALKVGQTVRITLRMANGTKITADFAVRGPAAMGPK